MGSERVDCFAVGGHAIFRTARRSVPALLRDLGQILLRGGSLDAEELAVAEAFDGAGGLELSRAGLGEGDFKAGVGVELVHVVRHQ